MTQKVIICIWTVSTHGTLQNVQVFYIFQDVRCLKCWTHKETFVNVNRECSRFTSVEHYQEFEMWNCGIEFLVDLVDGVHFQAFNILDISNIWNTWYTWTFLSVEPVQNIYIYFFLLNPTPTNNWCILTMSHSSAYALCVPLRL